jgi:uncharacterized protein YggU (UPF0235/DUF167 family)
VGGEHDGALVVRVTERAEGGRATSAALRAVADALSLPRRSVTLTRGATSRRKLVDIHTEDHDDESLTRLVEQLRRT